MIRRDNIGDLVCTTPIISALRQKYPNSYIAALVNSYNLPVLENNPDLDKAYAYTKAKHRSYGKTLLAVYWQRLEMLYELRQKHFDYAILAGPGYLPRVLRLASIMNVKHIIGFVTPNAPTEKIDKAILYTLPRPFHESEDVFRLLEPLGITGTPGKMTVVATEAEMAAARKHLKPGSSVIGIHISARKVSQRWPAERFVELMKQLYEEYKCSFMLFWSPGDEKNPLHPGDDNKAKIIIDGVKGLPVAAYPTTELRELIGGLAVCNYVICSDGGAMHLAAGVGKPIVAFFGKSDTKRWYPWGVPHKILQPESHEVTDVSVEQAVEEFRELYKK